MHIQQLNVTYTWGRRGWGTLDKVYHHSIYAYKQIEKHYGRPVWKTSYIDRNLYTYLYTFVHSQTCIHVSMDDNSS